MLFCYSFIRIMMDQELDLQTPVSKPDSKSGVSMKELLQEKSGFFVLPKVGDTLVGRVIEKAQNRIYLNLGAFKTGVVYKNEVDASSTNFQDIKKGDDLTVKILELENKEGFVEVSLNEVGLDKAWDEIRELKAKGEPFEVKIQSANRGGLITQINGVSAFLPVSQLSSANYPHVDGGDKDEILKLLKKFVGQTLTVKILDFDIKTSKVILSEKAQVSKETEAKLINYKVGDTVAGEVTGIVDFGAFVNFDGIEGLIHISEMAWQLVEKPSDILKTGQKVEAKVIAIEGEKVSLSLKALTPNPWNEVEKKYAKGDVVAGTVVKFNPFGAFVKIDPEIQGLAHISEFKTYKDMTAALELNKNYTFKITSLEPKEYKMALQPILENNKPETPTTESPIALS